MSNDNPNATNHEPHGHQAEDEVNYAKVVGIGVVSLIIFAIATYWAAIILRQETTRVRAEWGETTKPKLIGRAEIGIVDQVPFVADHRLEVWQKQRAAWLHGYGWVDRAKGIAHIPIEKAMDQVASGAAPAGAPR